MPGKLKTILIILVAIFLTYAVVRDPERAAAVVKSIWDLIFNTFEGFGKFFASLAG